MLIDFSLFLVRVVNRLPLVTEGRSRTTGSHNAFIALSSLSSSSSASLILLHPPLTPSYLSIIPLHLHLHPNQHHQLQISTITMDYRSGYNIARTGTNSQVSPVTLSSPRDLKSNLTPPGQPLVQPRLRQWLQQLPLLQLVSILFPVLTYFCHLQIED